MNINNPAQIMTLKLIAIGGLGAMLSPSAQHLKKHPNIRYIRILDRGGDNPIKQQRRDAWQDHGAQLVSSVTELVGDNDFDGVVICAGKNGDDYGILKELAPLLKAKQFILHLSTLSCAFVNAAYKFCSEHNIPYANYPLTGGVKGAESGKMLILASGDQTLYERLTPLLTAIGAPQYFGEEITQGAVVKLIGQVLVFHGLLGISLACVLHKNVSGLSHLDSQQVSFFDFLNQGAGGTKQWDVALRVGLAENKWDQGFLVHHAVIDAIYAASLLAEKNLPRTLILPLLEVVLLFAYLLKKDLSLCPATQAIANLIAEEPKAELDRYLQTHLSFDIQQSIKNCIHALPANLQKSLMLDVEF